MLKLVLLGCMSFSNLVYANDIKKHDKIEIFATKMETKNDIVTASGDVAVAYRNYYLTAKKAVYNKSTGDLELFNDVRANQGEEYKILGNYAKLNILNKERSFQPFYMLEKEMQVWISAEKGVIKNNDLEIASGVISGCNPTNPLWKMEFTSSQYNTDTKCLNLYHTKLYIYDIPVFYTPWFGYSLNKTRRTGLLKPTMGYSSDEGFYYEQPIYIAEDDAWDLEVKPQIRTSRGYGLYSTFRFTDSNISKGSLSLGGFRENDVYYKDKALANQYHRGFNFNYENSNFLKALSGKNFKGQSGIYADIGYMSDVDYINLAGNNTLNLSTSTQILSRINTFYSDERNYYGLYLKYYQDLTKVSNSDTIQQLPVLHYHHYLDTLFDNHLLYNIDVQSDNTHRKKGMKVTQTDVNIPVKIHTSLFDEYINVSFKTNLYLQHSAFSGDPIAGSTTDTRADYVNGYIAKSDNVFSLSTDLTKAYDDFSHIITLGSSYVFNGAENLSGYYKIQEEYCSNPLNQSEIICEFYNITQAAEESQVYFSQYIYDSFGNQVLYHKLAQSIFHDNKNELGEFENELEYTFLKNLVLYNNMFYNYDEKQFSRIYNKVSYQDKQLNISLAHLYRDTFLDKRPDVSYTEAHTSYVTSSFSYRYDNRYSYHGAFDYDLEQKIVKRKEIGFLYSKRCWDFGLRYVENNRPVLLQTTIDNIPERYIYFTVNLKPFMQSGDNPFFAFKLNDKE